MSQPRVFFLYTSPECSFCDKAKSLLEQRGHKFVAMELPWDHPTLIRLKEEMDWPTIPMIFEMQYRDHKFVGGFTDLQVYLGASDE
tara:strand:+ start:119 stop:376 length:258 start_codon:yes stop_codon:yes gene_type:complete